MEQSIDLTDKVVPQKELFSKAFLSIKNDVTRDDRINCAKEVNRSKRTIDEYVNGHVYDITIAQKILTFLKFEIYKRSLTIK